MKIPKLKNWREYLEFIKKISAFWTTKITWIFLVVFVIAAAYLVFIWYFYVFNSKWSDTRKQEYINLNGKEIILDQEKLNLVIKIFSERKENNNPGNASTIDVFHLK